MQRPACLPELTELLSALCDETISDTQFARLNELLKTDAAARQNYAVYMDMHCGLSRRWGEPSSVAHDEAQFPAPERHRPSRTWLLSVAAAAALIALTSTITLHVANPEQPRTGLVVSPPPDSPKPEAEPMTDSVAMLVHAIGAKWGETATAPSVGAPLSPGLLDLKAGIATVQFFSGASVVLQSPVKLRIVSANEAFCEAGKLSAEVPFQAHGFRVSTPHLTVVDLGTAFAMYVSAEHAEVHVLQGEVSLLNGGVSLGNLKEGEALNLRDGIFSRFAARPDAFITAKDVAQQIADTKPQQNANSPAEESRLLADPMLQIFFDFEKLKRGERSVQNLALNSSASGGLIIGCGLAEGRWVGRDALEFRSLSDRLRLSVPGEFSSLTMAVWLRVDGLNRLFSSLVMVDGYNPGAFHWQIKSDGIVRLGVAGPKNPGGREAADYDSPIIITPDRLGRWMHLAVVYDAEAGEVRHYLDGQCVNKLKLRFSTALRIGNCEIGNWNPATRADRFPIRNLSGRIDEFSLYSRVLSDAEVLQLYTSSGADGPPSPAK